MKHTVTSKYMEVFWSIGLGASQLSRTNRGSRPEILEMAPDKTEEEEVKQSCFFDRRVKPKNLERLNKMKENTTEMNEYENSVRKEEQGTLREPCRLKDMKKSL